MPCCSSSAAFPRFPLQSRPTAPNRPKLRLGAFRKPRRRLATPSASLHIEVQDIIEGAQNKVILTSVLAALTGQVSKPFADVLRGRKFDPMMIFRSGGMPSTHAASVVAATVCLGLERGFSDPIFGVAAVFAAIVMYDAQGVRYQVGKHAKTLNRFRDVRQQLIIYQGKTVIDSGAGVSSINSERAISISVSEKAGGSIGVDQEPNLVSVLPITSNKTNAMDSSSSDNHEEAALESLNFVPLNEYVGHTSVEVFAGALLGFVVCLTTESILP